MSEPETTTNAGTDGASRSAGGLGLCRSHVSIGMQQDQADAIEELNSCRVCGVKFDPGAPRYLVSQPRLNPDMERHGTFDVISLCLLHGARLQEAMSAP